MKNAEKEMLHTQKAEGKTGVRTPSMSRGTAFPVLLESIQLGEKNKLKKKIPSPCLYL